MSEERPEEPVTYALGRRPDRTYLSKSFPLGLPTSSDFQQWARYVTKVFDEPTDWIDRTDPSSELEWTEQIVTITPGGRRQLQIQLARHAGQIRQIEIQHVREDPFGPNLVTLLRLDRQAARRFVDLIELLKEIPVEGGQSAVRIDEETVRDVSADPDAIRQLYEQNPEQFQELIRTDTSAEDVVALARRRQVVQRFRQLLTDPDAFAEAQGSGRPEDVWQRFLERNPWVLGVSLAGQLFTSWDPQKLEKVVAGASVSGPGKRVDALLETTGRIRALVFAEIKHHRTRLLAKREVRSGCWPPSDDFAAAVTQSQQTVDIAVREIGDRLQRTDELGAETGEATYVVRPRSFLIIGRLDQLRGDQGVHLGKFRSFELYRRNLYEPEVITYDELLARAEWAVTMAAQKPIRA